MSKEYIKYKINLYKDNTTGSACGFLSKSDWPHRQCVYHAVCVEIESDTEPIDVLLISRGYPQMGSL